MALSALTYLHNVLFLRQYIETAQQPVCKISVASKASKQAQLRGLHGQWEEWGYICISFLAVLVNKLLSNISPLNFP